MSRKSFPFSAGYNVLPNVFPWANMAVQGTMLAIEAQQVIAMRLTKMAMGGPDVHREAELMVAEKLQTAAECGQMWISAALGGTSDTAPQKMLQLYRRKVRANRRRLGK
jgi:hypothetical protein